MFPSRLCELHGFYGIQSLTCYSHTLMSCYFLSLYNFVNITEFKDILYCKISLFTYRIFIRWHLRGTEQQNWGSPDASCSFQHGRGLGRLASRRSRWTLSCCLRTLNFLWFCYTRLAGVDGCLSFRTDAQRIPKLFNISQEDRVFPSILWDLSTILTLHSSSH